MKKVTGKQKNISMDVKVGQKSLRELLIELKEARDEARRTTMAVRAAKRLRNPAGSPNTPAGSQAHPVKKKIINNDSHDPGYG